MAEPEVHHVTNRPVSDSEAPSGLAPYVPASGGPQSAVTADAKPSRRGKLGIGGWLALIWMVFAIFCALFASLLPIPGPNERSDEYFWAPVGTPGHPLGTDAIGRDTLSRTIHGTRISMVVGVSAVLIGLAIGGGLGLYTGYFRNKFSSFLTWLFDVMLAFPQLVLALSLVAILASGEDVSATRRNFVLIIALGIVSIPILGRITRANTLSWSQREFVLAAKSLGAKDLRIVIRETLPNVLPAMFSITLLGIAVAIVAEGGLSVLGVGSSGISWGSLIAEGRNDLEDAPHVVFAPAAAIFLTVLSLNYLGDVIRSRFDVRESML